MEVIVNTYLNEMEDDEELYFEIRDGSDKVRIDFLGKSYPDAEENWDKNWLETTVSIRAGAFQGQYQASFMTVDFENFKQELKRIYHSLDGSALFTCLEDYLTFKIKGDGIGHFLLRCEATDRSTNRNKLEFELSFDQTQIPEFLKNLNHVTSKYPTIEPD